MTGHHRWATAYPYSRAAPPGTTSSTHPSRLKPWHESNPHARPPSAQVSPPGNHPSITPLSLIYPACRPIQNMVKSAFPQQISDMRIFGTPCRSSPRSQLGTQDHCSCSSLEALSQQGARLQAHHCAPFARLPPLRLILNGLGRSSQILVSSPMNSSSFVRLFVRSLVSLPTSDE